MWSTQSEATRDSLGLPITVYTITLDGIPMAETTDAERAEVIRYALATQWHPQSVTVPDVVATGEAFPD